MKIRLLIFLIVFLPVMSQAGPPSSEDLTFYRELTLKVRTTGSFKVPMPSKGNLTFSYNIKLAKPLYNEPITSDFYLNSETDSFFRDFWDKVFLEDGSYIELDGEKVPLTCVFIQGHDNRYTKKNTPLIPDLFLKVYLVANDYTCTGPINPGWPSNGLKKETWDTYFYFEIRDPTVMLPTEVRVRQRWVEFPAFLIDAGGK